MLRDETSRGSQKGDVYSFAIVVYEMFRRSETGNPYGELITLDKVIDLVKYPNGTKITRPDMKILSDPNLPVDVPDYVKGKTWTSLYMEGTAIKLFLVICPHEAGTWDPNYTPGVDFFDHEFL